MCSAGTICSHQETRSCLNDRSYGEIICLRAGTKVWSVLGGWHCLSRESTGSGETMHDHQALTAKLTAARASPYLSTPLSVSIWSAGSILWLQVNSFSVTLSAGRRKGGSALPGIPICSQTPQNSPFFKHILPLSWGALSSSCPLPWLCSIPFLRPVVLQCPQNPG